MNTRYLPLFVLIAALGFVGSSRMLRAQGESAGQPSAGATNGSLDYEYFKDKVEPIFLKKRPGHARCVSCHTTNNVRLHLVALSPAAATWDEVQSRENFELVKRVLSRQSRKPAAHPSAGRIRRRRFLS